MTANTAFENWLLHSEKIVPEFIVRRTKEGHPPMINWWRVGLAGLLSCFLIYALYYFPPRTLAPFFALFVMGGWGLIFLRDLKKWRYQNSWDRCDIRVWEEEMPPENHKVIAEIRNIKEFYLFVLYSKETPWRILYVADGGKEYPLYIWHKDFLDYTDDSNYVPIDTMSF